MQQSEIVAIVRIGEPHVLPARSGQARVARSGKTAVLRVRFQANARVGGREALNDGTAAVGRGIVYHDELPIGENLVLHIEDGIGDERLGAVHGHNNGEERGACRFTRIGRLGKTGRLHTCPGLHGHLVGTGQLRACTGLRSGFAGTYRCRSTHRLTFCPATHRKHAPSVHLTMHPMIHARAIALRYLAARLRRYARTAMKAMIPAQARPETTAPCTSSGEQ